MKLHVAVSVLAMGGFLLACSDSDPGTAGAPASPSPAKPAAASKPAPPAPPADPVAEGKQAYLTNCIACHNPDPTQDGVLGPAISGSSRELIEARVMRGEYPEGYTPKRETRNMVPMPFLESKLDVMAAYLNSQKGG